MERGGGGHSLPPSPNSGAVHTTVTIVWLICMKIMERGVGDTGQFGNEQESGRYVIHVSGTKIS